MILSLHTSPFPVAKVISSFCPLLYSPLRSNVATIAPTLTTRCSGITSEFPKLQSHSRQLKPDIDKQQHPLAESNRDVDDAAPANGKGYDDGIISGVQVPRSRYISVSKSELLNAIVITMFESEAEADLFIQLSKGLDSILHAEHKCFLEEMRVNYDLTHSAGSFGRMGLSSDLEREYAEKKKEFEDFFRKSVEFLSKEGYEGDMPERGNSSIRPDLQSQSDISGKSSFKLSRAAADTQFQRAFGQLLHNAEFEELSVRDLLLSSALNNDYLLTLPVYVDWKKASESNAIIYRRGYTTEKQKGLLTGEKLDYLQSKLLQKIFSLIAKPLGNVGLWLVKVIGGNSQDDYMRGWVDNLKLWLKKLLLSQPQSYSSDGVASSNLMEVDYVLDSDIPIWLAAQKAVIRYEGILSAIGPRSRLLRMFLMWIGVLSTDPQQAFNNESGAIDFEAESCPRPIFLPRVSLADIWEPASRENCGNDLWKKLKTSISILLSKSTLQEPAFEEIVLLYSEPLDERDNEDKAGVPALQLKIYERIPVPDLTVIFPYKKLSFRILDAVRLDLATILGLLAYFVNYKFEDVRSSPAAADTQFQRAFGQLLHNAEFEELSVRDLLLSSALNNDYLLTLPVYVDWKKASESNAIIYRRGYTTEKQKGLLTGEKLDYLQSKLLQKIFSLIAKPLGNVGLWLVKVIGGNSQDDYMRGWVDNLKLWLKKLLLSQPQSYSSDGVASSNLMEVDYVLDSDIPIWLAAQKAVIRYEGILSAIGPRSRLLRMFLMWIGVLSTDPQQAFNNESGAIDFEAESCPRPIFLPRVSLADIWEPASRENCGNDLWKKLKTSISILLSKSTLQEPAFEEIVLLYSEPLDERDNEDKAGVPALQLKIYERIPVPDLTVIFPYKKLSFRILDAVRLDLATILGLLAYFVNYKFEDVRSSPSAVLLDIIAASALLIYVFRVVLGYKQTRDRYQLLVNRTLYEKTVASGFGSVHFLIDASQQQLYKEAILAYAILLQADTRQVPCASIGGRCEEFLYDVFKKKIEMPVNKAKSTLLRLGLVEEKIVNGEIVLEATHCSEACEILKHRWDVLLT